MAKTRKSVTAYPEDLVYGIIGTTSPAVNRALTAWAEILKASEPELTRAEWNYLAAAYEPVKLDAECVRCYQGDDLAGRVADMHLFDGLGERFSDDADAFVAALVEKCRAMTWQQVQYIVAAIAFREHVGDGIDTTLDEWWTLPYRVRSLKEEADAKA